MATSLGARQVCQRAFDLAQVHPVRSAVVTDAQALQACLRFIDDHRLHVEPACGAALALAYGWTKASSAPSRDWASALASSQTEPCTISSAPWARINARACSVVVWGTTTVTGIDSCRPA